MTCLIFNDESLKDPFSHFALFTSPDIDEFVIDELLANVAEQQHEHIFVPTGIGSGRASLVYNIHAMLHMMVVDMLHWPIVKKCCELVEFAVTDHGVESLITSAPTTILTGDYLPCIGKSEDGARSPWWAEMTGGGCNVRRIFPNAMWLPGILHTLHSAAGDVVNGLLELTPALLARASEGDVIPEFQMARVAVQGDVLDRRRSRPP